MNKLFLGAVALSLAMISCTKSSTEKKEDVDSGSYVTIDHLSGSTKVKSHPENVVILQYGSLDTYEQLGLKNLVKGIPLSELPQYLIHFKNEHQLVGLGTTMEANMEKINELNPDLIIIGSRLAPKYDQFSKIAPTINLEADKKNYWQSFTHNNLEIAKLYGKEDQMKASLNNLEKRIEKIKTKAENSSKKALIVLTNEGKMSVYGPKSRFGLIHDVLGVKAVDNNIEVSSHGQSVSNEYIQQVNPDIIFVIDRGAALKREKATMEQFANPLIAKTNAYKTKNIIFLDPELWYLSGGGLKSFSMMLDEIEKVIQ